MKRLLLGIGQCGIDIVENISPELSMDTAVVDLDKYALHSSGADQKIYVCETDNTAQGEDLGIDYEVDIKSLEDIRRVIEPYTIVYIISALGGRAGGVILPAVAKMAQEQGKQVRGKLILPFQEEEAKREIAELYLDDVKELFADVDVYDNHEYISRAEGEVTMDSIYSVHSIFDEINRDILREIQRDVLYEEGS